MSGHTPGPWVRWDEPPFETAPGDIVIGEDNGFTVAVVFNTPRLDVEANARLIAEAPAMYEALLTAEPALEAYVRVGKIINHPDTDKARYVLDAVREVLARLTPISPEHDGGQ